MSSEVRNSRIKQAYKAQGYTVVQTWQGGSHYYDILNYRGQIIGKLVMHACTQWTFWQTNLQVQVFCRQAKLTWENTFHHDDLTQGVRCLLLDDRLRYTKCQDFHSKFTADISQLDIKGEPSQPTSLTWKTASIEGFLSSSAKLLAFVAS